MKEYTLISLLSLLIILYIDRKVGSNLLKKSDYYVFLVVILLFKLLVNGYLTGSGIVMYNPDRYLGLRIGSIPIEDFMFGFSMVTLGIIVYEKCAKRRIK